MAGEPRESTIRRVWKVIAMALAAAGMAGALWAFAIYGRYWDTLPRSPDVGSGRVYAFSVRGDLAYATLQERTQYDRIEQMSTALFAVGFVLMLTYAWQSRRERRSRH